MFRELHINLCIVRVQEVAKNLDVMLVGHIESLLHRRALQRGILVDFIFLHDKMVEVLFDDDAVNSDVITQVFFFGHGLLVEHIHVVSSLDSHWNTILNSQSCEHSLLYNLFGKVTDDLGRLLRDEIESNELAVAWGQDLNLFFVYRLKTVSQLAHFDLVSVNKYDVRGLQDLDVVLRGKEIGVSAETLIIY